MANACVHRQNGGRGVYTPYITRYEVYDAHYLLIGKKEARKRGGRGAGDQVVGHAAAGGDDDHEAVPLGPLLLDLGRHILDAVDVADGSAAVFLDNQGHP